MAIYPSRDRRRLAEALALWGEAIETSARTLVGRLDRQEGIDADTVDTLVKQIVVELVITVGAIAVTLVESTPDWVGKGIQGQALATLAANVLNEINRKADVLIEAVQKANVERLLKILESHPKFAETARQFGARTVEQAVRPIALEHAAKLRRTVKEAVPVVLGAARESTSVAILETQLRRGLQRPPWWQFSG